MDDVVAAVYLGFRHDGEPPARRRQILAISAVRLQQPRLAARFAGPAAFWTPHWGRGLLAPSQGNTLDRGGRVWAVAAGQTTVVTSSGDDVVWIHDPVTGEPRGEWLRQLGMGSVRALAQATVAGVETILVGGADGEIRSWELVPGGAATYLGPSLRGHTGRITALACTTVDGTPIAVSAGGDGGLRGWELTSWRQAFTLVHDSRRVWAMACTDVDGEPVVVTGTGDGEADVWDLASRHRRLTVPAHRGRIRAVTTTVLDGRPVAVTAGEDGTALVWGLDNGAPVARLPAGAPIRALSAVPMNEGVIVVTGADDGALRAWEPGTGHLVAETMLPHPILALAWAPGRNLVVSTGPEVIAMHIPAGSVR
jgi:WD40 repeat protein